MRDNKICSTCEHFASPLCLSCDDNEKHEPSKETLKSQLSAVTQERDQALGERDIFKNQFIRLIDELEKELDKDGWCRLVITQEKLQEFKSFLLEFSSPEPSEGEIYRKAFEIACQQFNEYSFCPLIFKEGVIPEGCTVGSDLCKTDPGKCVQGYFISEAKQQLTRRTPRNE